jgi:hypothetical protein
MRGRWCRKRGSEPGRRRRWSAQPRADVASSALLAKSAGFAHPETQEVLVLKHDPVPGLVGSQAV